MKVQALVIDINDKKKIYIIHDRCNISLMKFSDDGHSLTLVASTTLTYFDSMSKMALIYLPRLTSVSNVTEFTSEETKSTESREKSQCYDHSDGVDSIKQAGFIISVERQHRVLHVVPSFQQADKPF